MVPNVSGANVFSPIHYRHSDLLQRAFASITGTGPTAKWIDGMVKPSPNLRKSRAPPEGKDVDDMVERMLMKINKRKRNRESSRGGSRSEMALQMFLAFLFSSIPVSQLMETTSK